MQLSLRKSQRKDSLRPLWRPCEREPIMRMSSIRNYWAIACMGLISTVLPQSPVWAEVTNLNDDWAFHRDDAPGAERADYDDSSWRRVLVPHDWSIEDLPGQNSPFDPKAIAKEAQGYTVGGIGWYRRTILLPADVATKSVLLRFEAIYMDSQIWVNGKPILRHPYGYTAFVADVSDAVVPGKNTIAIKVNHEEPSSRWYSGSGLIRPVHLEVLDRVHLDPWGPAITTPTTARARATVRISGTITNSRSAPAEARLVSIILGPDGKERARDETRTSIPANRTISVERSATVPTPALWSPATPSLYTLVQELRTDEIVLDTRRTPFGIRTISFDAAHGFRLNGQKLLLRGGAMHHDNYMLGGAGIPRADERKAELMKAAGYNAIRSSHNPASQATLDAADRLGLLVIDEAFDMWSRPKSKNDYARFFPNNWRSDLTSMILTGRNHPSVILWSIGNEIPNMTSAAGAAEAEMLATAVHQLDSTRPVTAAMHLFTKGMNEFADKLDVAGYNYWRDNYASDHGTRPNRIMYGSESFSAEAFDYWSPTATMPWVIGDFVWSAIDYLGEASIGWYGAREYPWHLCMCGEIDATGRLRPAAYYRQVLWHTGITPTSAFLEWPTPDGSLPSKGANSISAWTQPDLFAAWQSVNSFFPMKVVAFSENEEVELFVNGKSVGRKLVSRATEYKAEFWIRYVSGELEAVGYVRGKPVSHWTLKSAGNPASVRLTVDRSKIHGDGDDLAYITAELLDDKNVPTYKRTSDRLLHFSVRGAGTLAGVGNGNPMAVESFQSGARSTFNGRAVAVVRAGKIPGNVVVEVSSDELPTATATVIVE